MTRELLQVWAMPWAELPESLTFGEIELWDFFKEGANRIKDSGEMLSMALFATCFKDRHDAALTRLTIVQHGETPLSRQGGAENDVIRWAGNAIAFCYLAGAIQNHATRKPKEYLVGCSERFGLICTLIDEDRNVHYSNWNEMGVAALVGQKPIFREPPQIIDKANAPDRLLLEYLAKLGPSKSKAALQKRLKVCFEWFITAWSASPDISHPARFIALMTAFESVIKTGTERAYDMALAAAVLCGWSDFPNTEHVRINGRLVEVSKPVKFIMDYAGYRNAFVHGDELKHGWIYYSVDGKEFEARLVMSLIIYCAVCNLLLNDEGPSESFENEILRGQIRSIEKLLQWKSDVPLSPSSHLEPDRIAVIPNEDGSFFVERRVGLYKVAKEYGQCSSLLEVCRLLRHNGLKDCARQIDRKKVSEFNIPAESR